VLGLPSSQGEGKMMDFLTLASKCKSGMVMLTVPNTLEVAKSTKTHQAYYKFAILDEDADGLLQGKLVGFFVTVDRAEFKKLTEEIK
jgi:hypothetical protein